MSEPSHLFPVLLCGGAGTRLWPLSRKSYPKQFVPLVGEESLFQACAKRLSGPGFAAPRVVTSADYRFIVRDQLRTVGCEADTILIEPEGRNTAPAILAAALDLAKLGDDAIMLVAPSDHVIPDIDAFRAAVEKGRGAVEAGGIVTFGIKPTRAETGYGYLALDDDDSGDTIALRRFVEKPKAKAAQRMLDEGGYLWNAGIFMFTAGAIIAAFEAHAPDMVAPVRRAVDEAKSDLDFLRLDPEAWAEARADSVDYAVMEKARNLSVVPFAEHWSDLGDWQAVWRERAESEADTVTTGLAIAIDSDGTLLRSEAENQVLVGLGLKDIVAVAMPDAVLIADRKRAQDVKSVVVQLKADKAPQAEQLPRDYRPWGWFEGLAIGPSFQVKRIVVDPGGKLSLQSHEYRSEHWIVVAGVATVTIGEEVRDVRANESVYIPLGVKHRMENRQEEPMVLIEVQTGTYFGEDDIIRYDDVYARD